MKEKTTILIGGVEASTDGWEWECKEEIYKNILEAWAGRDVVDSYTPSYSYSMALLAVQKFNAKIISHETDDIYVEGRVY